MIKELYELTNYIQDFQDTLDKYIEGEESVPEEQMALFEEFVKKQEDVEKTLKNIIMATLNLNIRVSGIDSYIQVLESELKKLKSKKNVLTSRQDFYKKVVLDNLDKTANGTIKTDLFSAYPQTTYSLNVFDPDKIKDLKEYVAGVETILDTKKIKDDLMSDKKIEGATLIEKTTLRIR